MFNRFSKKPSSPSTLCLQAILSGALSLITTSVLATSPTEFDIDGNTITFNFADWYQVQNASDLNSWCEGNDPCTVPDGEYIIINHSTMERFTANVGVTEFTEAVALPDDGWYQVQNATTYESVCEGVRSCTVETGRYIVINHTTGVRTEISIPTTPIVSDIDAYPPYSDFVIDGNNITFTAPGWFQVQEQYNYLSVCEGSEPCSVDQMGFHQIINFSTGERWTDVYIGEDHSRTQCRRLGGAVIGDPGDGSVHQPEYRCASGQPPIFTIFPLIGEPISIEGDVCCL